MRKPVSNPLLSFEHTKDWAKVPAGWRFNVAAVTVDSQDRVYAFNRGEHPVLVFDKHGEFLYSWGEGMFAFPHGIFADACDNIWAVDRDRGQIFKFTPKGELLMTIGTRGFRSDTGVPADLKGTSSLSKAVTHGGGPFNLPTNLAVAGSGDIFITDGYANCQVHRFSPEGQYLYSWGEPGSGPGQFMLPHGIWIDSRGRVLVADRENDRVQVFAQSGEFIEQWPTPLIGAAVFWVNRDDQVFVAEHNSGDCAVLNLDGELLARWNSGTTKSCHGVAGDSDGNIYFVQYLSDAGRASGRRVVKYVRKAPI